MPFHVKKGAADPFRGNWYLPGSIFNTSSEAITLALNLTNENYVEFGRSWDEFGYEWSVFEESPSGEKKIWEGYKAIAEMRKKQLSLPQQEDGWV
jgi:hypothetical protein